MHRRLVLFVCEHGAAKSVVAAAHFNHLARRAGLAAFAASRGITPELQVLPAARLGLETDGLSAGVTPAELTADIVHSASHVVTFGVDLPFAAPAATRVESWAEVPPISADYDASRTAIVTRVRALIEEMVAAQTLDEDDGD